MALPALTAETCAEALKKAAAVRKERGEVLASLKEAPGLRHSGSRRGGRLLV